jgi:putative flippase GtrA
MKANAGLRGARLFRFLVAGAVNTALGLAIYPLLYWLIPPLRIHYMLALAISQIFCVLFAYVNYKVAVFRTRGNIVREFSIFSTFYLVILATNWLALPVLVELGHVSPLVGQLAFMLPVVVGSYLWHSRVTFVAAESDN